MIGFWENYVHTPGFQKAFRKTIAELNNAGMEVSVLKQVPSHFTSLPQSIALSNWWGYSAAGLTSTRTEYLKQRNDFDQFLNTCDAPFTTLDPISIFYPGGCEECSVIINGKLIYRDGSHLSTAGSEALGSIIGKFLRE